MQGVRQQEAAGGEKLRPHREARQQLRKQALSTVAAGLAWNLQLGPQGKGSQRRPHAWGNPQRLLEWQLVLYVQIIWLDGTCLLPTLPTVFRTMVWGMMVFTALELWSVQITPNSHNIPPNTILQMMKQTQRG